MRLMQDGHSEVSDNLPMELSIICVNWNSLDYLRECVASIYQFTSGVSFEIIVVDNASPQRGVDTLIEQFPNITIIKSEQNLGFAGANNFGFRQSTGEYVLFLNPDTKLIGPALNIMLGQIKSLPDAGILGCKLLNSDYSVQLTSFQKFPTILNQLLDVEYLQLRWPRCPLWDIGPLFSDDVKQINVEVISGACMLLRREAFEQAGMFSEDYFMYAEDIDLNYKVKRAGLKNYYIGKAVIIHHGGGSSSQQWVSQWKTIMKYRAMRRYYRKTRGPVYASMYRAAMGGAALARLILLALAYPLGKILWDTKSIEIASEKWTAVLKWAIGWQNQALEDR
jgi:N-acetylglucosaminyl-diphospho-decaprenol L-rhamnosyltransferase